MVEGNALTPPVKSEVVEETETKTETVVSGRRPVSEDVAEALRQVRSETAESVSTGSYMGEEAVYLENMLEGRSSFAGDRVHGQVSFMPHGYEGSVQQVPPSLLRNSDMRRRLSRKVVRRLSPEEAEARMSELAEWIEWSPREGVNNPILKALSEGADTASRYTRDDLQDTGFERGQIDGNEVAKQLYGQKVNKTVKKVKRSTATNPTAEVFDADVKRVDVVQSPEDVLTPRVKEGEMAPDVGRTRRG